MKGGQEKKRRFDGGLSVQHQAAVSLCCSEMTEDSENGRLLMDRLIRADSAAALIEELFPF